MQAISAVDGSSPSRHGITDGAPDGSRPVSGLRVWLGRWPALFRAVSLRTHILLLLVGMVVGLTLLILTSVLMISEQASERAMERDFRTLGGFLNQLLEERARSMTEISKVMVSQPTTLSYLYQEAEPGAGMARADRETIADLTEDIRVTMGASRVALIDAGGRTIGDSAGATSTPISERGFRSALRGRRWRGMIEENGQPAVAVCVPILSPDGQFVRGAFFASKILDDELARQMRNALGKDIAFLHRSRPIASSVPLSWLPPLPTKGQTRQVMYVHDALYIIDYQRLTLFPNQDALGVVLMHPQNEATLLVSDLRAGILGCAAAALLLAFLVGSLVADRVVRPLDDVVAAARQIRFGVWPEHLPTDRSDEIGLLQSAFNEMTTTIRTAQERLLARIDTDPLTDLESHRRFRERLAQEVRRSIDFDETLALLLVDLDQFRVFNERNNLGTGDRILCHVATALKALLPPVATIARYGGDEFGIILPCSHPAEAQRTAELIVANLANPEGTSLTVSIGFALNHASMAEPEPLLLAAEFALTQAKHQGGNTCFGFDPLSISVAAPRLSPTEEFITAPSGMQYLFHSLRDGSLVAIQALAAAVDAKDRYTEGHSHRVADLSVRFAERLGFSPEEVSRVHTAATLHDVGKIGVPDRILQKQGQLEPEEMRMMEAHAVMGEMIAAKIPQIARCVSGIRSHHERWDGRGYPDGLRGEDIPLIARIIALADAFDAMTTDRPYRRGRSTEEALATIIAGSGSQFDPDLVPSFLIVVRETERPQSSVLSVRKAA
ncbi:MAG: diguanylate cyclase [Capsulimonadales bacterium]|nr:diguanylate cyclase [Capsulimonadales bacterium]